MQDEEFLAVVVPTLRADIRMLEAYERTAPNPLSCPITAFGGSRDQTVPMENIAVWTQQTTDSFTRVILDEEHLFLQSAREELTTNVRETLLGANHGVD
jgi:surfactin synthase thioesterase subunit